MLSLTIFSSICGICLAESNDENDQIIKRVHESSGLIFASPPYWGRETTRIGLEQLAEHIEKVISKEVVLVILKDYEMLKERTLAGEIDICFYGTVLYIETKEI